MSGERLSWADWADIIAACSDDEPLTIHAYTWLPPIPYRENRRLPMPLQYANTPSG